MARTPQISIVTPCFNGSSYVARFLESILAQTEGDAELILVDDGSTDNTEEIVMSYEHDLKSTLRGFSYVKQSNGGLGSALNTGLGRVSGKYLVWPDSDDFLEPTSLSERLAILQRHTDFACVTSDAFIRDAERIDTVRGQVSDGVPHNTDPFQFEHLLRGQSIFCPGTHMVRMDAFDKTHPERQIFPARRGQNWQMLLPLYYHYKRFYLDRPLYNYVVRSDSMSRGDDSLDLTLLRAYEHREIKLATLSTIAMGDDERLRFANLVDEIYFRQVLDASLRHQNRAVAVNAYATLRRSGFSTPRDAIVYYGNSNTLTRSALARARTIRRTIDDRQRIRSQRARDDY